MSQNFCTSCGAPLAQGQKFCTCCGKAIIAPSTEPEATVPLAPLNSTGEISTNPQPLLTAEAAHSAEPSPASAPSVVAIPVDSPIGESPATSTAPFDAPMATPVLSPDTPPPCDPPSSSPKKGIAVALLCALVGTAIIVATLFVAGVFKMPEAPSDEPIETPQEQPSAPDEETVENASATDAANASDEADSAIETDAPATTESAQSEPPVDRAEAVIYDKLLVLYNDLGAFDQRISEAAQQFNENYLSLDYETRARYATEAEALLDDIYSSYNDLYSTTISPQSPNTAAYEALDTCYEDCVQRISVISEAWTISLSYEDPTAYRDEILVPIMRDNVNGSNLYYTEFQETYPLAEPVAPQTS